MNSPLAVIDSQSVLDWQYFENPLCAAWTSSLAAGQWHWIASPAMRDELAHVLSRGIAGSWPGTPQRVLAFFDAHARLVEARQVGASQRLPCSDADDQKFLDLAITHSARWLVSRDRAVLKLRRRAAKQGLVILPPSQWLLAPTTELTPIVVDSLAPQH